jgi:hypothetical protein
MSSLDSEDTHLMAGLLLYMRQRETDVVQREPLAGYDGAASINLFQMDVIHEIALPVTAFRTFTAWPGRCLLRISGPFRTTTSGIGPSARLWLPNPNCAGDDHGLNDEAKEAVR